MPKSAGKPLITILMQLLTPDEAGLIIADARNLLERIERAFDEMGLKKYFPVLPFFFEGSNTSQP